MSSGKRYYSPGLYEYNGDSNWPEGTLQMEINDDCTEFRHTRMLKKGHEHVNVPRPWIEILYHPIIQIGTTRGTWRRVSPEDFYSETDF